MNQLRGFVRIAFCVLAANVLVGTLLVGSSASAKASWDVTVGRFFKEADHSAESMRFFPASLKIHQGDVLHFTSGSFHSVALLPSGQDADTWVSTNAGGVDKPWSIFSSDFDEGSSSAKANLGALYPTRACGWPSQPICSFDGSDDLGVLHSGLPLFPQGQTATVSRLDFTVEIDAAPGSTISAIDLIHPALRMSIQVVAATDATTDPSVATQTSNQAFAADKAAAAKLDKAYANKHVKKNIGGKVTWLAWAGLETSTISLRRMYPTKLTIAKGQRVQWQFSKDVFSSHTVTFPASKGISTAAGFPQIVCDPDGDSPGTFPQPDSPPSSSDYPYCSDLSQLEVDVPTDITTVVGNGVVTGKSDFENSGVRGKGLAVSSAPYTLTFTKPSSKVGFKYVCMVYRLAHVNMQGTVVVKP
jgi:plastocyanin